MYFVMLTDSTGVNRKAVTCEGGRANVVLVCIINGTPRDTIVACLVGWIANSQISEIYLKYIKIY
jgi:hypothetical protein